MSASGGSDRDAAHREARRSSAHGRGLEAGRARGSELGYEAGYRASGEITHVDMRQPDEVGSTQALLDYIEGFGAGCLETVQDGFKEGWEAGCPQ